MTAQYKNGDPMAGKIWREYPDTLTPGWIQKEESEKAAEDQKMRFLRCILRCFSQVTSADCYAVCRQGRAARKAGLALPQWHSAEGESTTQEHMHSARLCVQYVVTLFTGCLHISPESSVYQNCDSEEPVCSSCTGYTMRWQEGYT